MYFSDIKETSDMIYDMICPCPAPWNTLAVPPRLAKMIKTAGQCWGPGHEDSCNLSKVMQPCLTLWILASWSLVAILKLNFGWDSEAEKFGRDLEACWNFCFELRSLNEPVRWVRCAFGNVLFLLSIHYVAIILQEAAIVWKVVISSMLIFYTEH